MYQPDLSGTAALPVSEIFPCDGNPTAQAPDKAAALFSAAQSLLPVLESGRPLDAHALRDAMTSAFGSGDDTGAWLWKDAYEAAEASVVLFLRQYWPSMSEAAGEAPEGARKLIRMLDRISHLEPSHTKRSQDQVRLQQFSTPLPLAFAVLTAAAVRPGDVVLEPSAGTGMLAILAECAMGRQAHGSLVLNELAPVRAGVLSLLFPGSRVSRHNAESMADYLPDVRPSVVVMNPPFSASPGVSRARHDADLRHIRSAFSMLPAGGRLVALTSSGCSPAGEDWKNAFSTLPAGEGSARTVLSVAIDGRAYARRGTSAETRLTVLDRCDDPNIDFDPLERVADAAELLEAVISRVPDRIPLEPVNADIFGRPANAPGEQPAARSRARRIAGTRGAPRTPHDWGAVSELAIETGFSASRDVDVSDDSGSGPYAAWRPGAVRIPGAVEHPTPLVQSGAMAAVCHPVPSYRPMLPGRVVTEGLLSDAQLESVVLAGEAFSGHLDRSFRIGSGWETLLSAEAADSQTEDAGCNEVGPEDEKMSSPVRFRRGWMLGDGTGAGKGRQVAGILLDNWLRGRKRALWLSLSDKLLEDARRDWCSLGGRADDVIPLGRFRQGDVIPYDEGILFATYSTLRSPARMDKPSRLDQVVQWLAGSLDEESRHSFDGLVIFDEAHAMANAAGGKGNRGDVAPSQQGRAGLRLQHALPDARVAYVSATGATTVPGLAYAGRLGLWSSGDTPFEKRSDFVAAMEAGGVAALEVISRDLKALGLYQARALSYDGVEVDILEHRLSDAQRGIYDAYAGAFKVIHQNIEAALKATGIVDDDATRNKAAKSSALSLFESAKQRFFGHLLTGMKCPSLIRAIETDLEFDRSVVIQLVSTGESLMERRIAEIPPSEWDDLNIDLTPRENVIEFLQHGFPVQLQEPFEDEKGNILSRPVFDDDGNPVLCREAVQRRDALVEKLASLPPVPTALDRIVQHFGHDAVAEVTGRSRRILRIADSRGERLTLRNRPTSANLSESAAFMDGKKRILVFSQAGGTGRSYHADLSCANTQRRVHYLLEPGWRADQAIQGLGRTHRTHQASAPLFRPVTTDVKGERRFIATIARRLDSLGAITRGQRDSQTAMGGDRSLFRASDNLESLYAKAALRMFFSSLWLGRIPGWSVENFENATGLKLVHEGSLREDLPPMSRFLNRLLALPIAEQNELFTELETRIDANIDQAMEAGTFEVGVETIRAGSMAIAGREVLYTHPGTGAVTELVEVLRRDELKPTSADRALDIGSIDGSVPRLVVNERSQRSAVVIPAPSHVFDDGGIQQRVRLVRPAARDTMPLAELEASTWRPADEATWRTLWDQEISTLPAHREIRFWLASGLLLPVWDRLPEENMRVRRLTSDTGEALIGRMLDLTQARAVRTAFGLDGSFSMSCTEAFDTVMGRGDPLSLVNGWRLARRRIMGADRLEIEGPAGNDLQVLRQYGCSVEIVSYRARAFAPRAEVLDHILDRWPVAA